MKTQFSRSVARPWAGCTGARQRGFTLIELIMVMVMLGVLAVFAAPRIFNSDDFYARGFHDETLGLLRYAQKTAIAQRRTVCVAFTSNQISLTIAAAASDLTCPPTASLSGPNGTPRIEARSIVTFNPGPVSPSTYPPTNFNFDGLGRPITGTVDSTGQAVLMARQLIQISKASDVIVESETGYVHD